MNENIDGGLLKNRIKLSNLIEIFSRLAKVELLKNYLSDSYVSKLELISENLIEIGKMDLLDEEKSVYFEFRGGNLISIEFHEFFTLDSKIAENLQDNGWKSKLLPQGTIIFTRGK